MNKVDSVVKIITAEKQKESCIILYNAGFLPYSRNLFNFVLQNRTRYMGAHGKMPDRMMVTLYKY
jgi:hypothetical protein